MMSGIFVSQCSHVLLHSVHGHLVFPRLELVGDPPFQVLKIGHCLQRYNLDYRNLSLGHSAAMPFDSSFRFLACHIELCCLSTALDSVSQGG